eukprot:c36892_g1_i1 orf=157-402(+)
MFAESLPELTLKYQHQEDELETTTDTGYDTNQNFYPKSTLQHHTLGNFPNTNLTILDSKCHMQRHRRSSNVSLTSKGTIER